MKNYSDISLHPIDLDMSKEWFVYFYWTTDEGRIQKRYRFGLNRIKVKRERLKVAHAMMKELEDLLSTGWNPLTNKKEEKTTILDHFDEIMNTKRVVMKAKSVRTYDDILKIFKVWMNKKHYQTMYPEMFTNNNARQFMDHLLVDKKYMGKTHNHILGIMRTFFNALVDREIITKNPFRGIKELPEDQGKNFPFTVEEKNKLKEYLLKNNLRLYYACQFVYYCFVRRSELIQLKVGDINWESKTITINSSVSKNRKQESVTIPTPFEKVLIEMGLKNAPKDYFIFGKKLQTSQTPTHRPDDLSTPHRKATRFLGIGEEKGFYPWKHTGVCDLYNATKDIYLVMQQCRHSDTKITLIYLRSLGLTVNEKIRNADYSF